MPGVVAIPSIPSALVSGSPGVCSVDNAIGHVECNSRIGPVEKSSSANICEARFRVLLRWSAPAFVVPPCRDESPLRTSGTYLTQLAVSTAGHMWLVKLSSKISHIFSLYSYIYYYFFILIYCSLFIYIYVCVCVYYYLLYINLYYFNYIFEWRIDSLVLNIAKIASKSKMDESCEKNKFLQASWRCE